MFFTQDSQELVEYFSLLCYNFTKEFSENHNRLWEESVRMNVFTSDKIRNVALLGHGGDVAKHLWWKLWLFCLV